MPIHPTPMTTGECRMENNLHAKEAVLRRLLEMRARQKGCGHYATWEIINRLAKLLKDRGDARGGMALRTKYTNVNMDDPESAVILSCLALDWRKVGCPNEAELLLRQALEIENRLLSRDSYKHPHRLNNLATVLIMQGKLAEAKGLLRCAWKLMKGKHDTTSTRILVSRIAVSLLESRLPGIHIGRLKTLLYDRPPNVAGNITATTKAAVMIDHLRRQFSNEHFGFLHALFRAINDPENMSGLERFSLWQNCPALPLDVPVSASSV